MKAIELKNQLLCYSDEDLSELDLILEVYIEEEDDYYVTREFLFLRKSFEYEKDYARRYSGLQNLTLSNVDQD